MGIELDHRVRGMIASSSVNMVRDRRGSYIVMTIAVSGVATLENKETHWSLSSISMKVGTRCRSSSFERFSEGCSSPFTRLAEHLMALHAWCKQCLSGR